MTYSCTDFADSIIDALGVTIPEESNDSPSDQADICLAEIERLQRAAAGAASFYAVHVYGDVEPYLFGPFATEAEQDREARRLRAENPDDGIYWLDVDATGRPQMGAYSGAFFEAEPATGAGRIGGAIMRVTVWTCTTDGDNMPIETEVCPTFEAAAEPCRIALREMDWDARHGTPLDTAEQITDAWQETFDGVCIIEAHTINVPESAVQS